MIEAITEKDREIILKKLTEIEQTENVQVIYACEGGSRSWGMHSHNSDYDIRFIYKRNVEWYLTIEEKKRDVIERKYIDEDYDVVGWDIKKALYLFHKGNASVYEHINSKYVYYSDGKLQEKLQALGDEFFPIRTIGLHYIHMAYNNYSRYINKKDPVELKKYLYVIRPLLATCWIDKYATQPPTTLQTLIDDPEIYNKERYYEDIQELINRKRDGEELSKSDPIPNINALIDELFARFNTWQHKANGHYWNEQKAKLKLKLNDIFQEYILGG